MNFGEEIWCVLSEEMSFVTFTPIWSRVNENEKNWQKSKISQFFNNFGRDPLKIIFPWSHVNEYEKYS